MITSLDAYLTSPFTFRPLNKAARPDKHFLPSDVYKEAVPVRLKFVPAKGTKEPAISVFSAAHTPPPPSLSLIHYDLWVVCMMLVCSTLLMLFDTSMQQARGTSVCAEFLGNVTMVGQELVPCGCPRLICLTDQGLDNL